MFKINIIFQHRQVKIKNKLPVLRRFNTKAFYISFNIEIYYE